MCAVSIPASVAAAEWKDLKPSIGRVIHLFRIDIPSPQLDGACQGVRPLVNATRTASRLNSAECAEGWGDFLCGRMRS